MRALLFLLLGISTLSSIKAAVSPAHYDAKDYEVCGLGWKHKRPKRKPIDYNGFMTDSVKKVMGGQRVPAGEMPWMTKIEVIESDGLIGHCSGALISKKHVLTAAHCFQANNSKKEMSCKLPNANLMKIKVFVGMTTRGKEATSEDTGIPRTASRIFMVDERYIKANCSFDDMVILELDSEVDVGKYPPICLLDRDESAKEMGRMRHIEKDAILAGYGFTKPNFTGITGVLHKVPVAPIDLCDFPPPDDDKVCSESYKGQGGSHGDSGAPLTVLLKGRYYVYGVQTSAHIDVGERMKGTAFVRLEPRMKEVRGILNPNKKKP